MAGLGMLEATAKATVAAIGVGGSIYGVASAEGTAGQVFAGIGLALSAASFAAHGGSEASAKPESQSLNSGTPGRGTPEARAAFEADIAALEADGTLSSTRSFATADAAAAEPLEAISPLSEKYGFEAGGKINGRQLRHGGERYFYSIPEVGGPSSIRMSPGSYGAYHSHPDGGLMFSNSQFNAGSGSGDAGWVANHGKPVYLGVASGGRTSIGVCSPGACPTRGLLGTQPSRVVR
jgi:hypothetical protein